MSRISTGRKRWRLPRHTAGRYTSAQGVGATRSHSIQVSTRSCRKGYDPFFWSFATPTPTSISYGECICARSSIKDPYVEDAGDLIVEWDFETCGDSISYRDNGDRIVARLGESSGPGAHWNAEHRPEGIFIAMGPAIRSGVRVPCSIYDVAPTALYLRDLPVPSGMDGSLVTDVLEPEHLDANPVRMTPSDVEDGRTKSVELSPEDQKLIEDRLRGLGYIE